MTLRRIGDVVWELPAEAGMRVPGRIYADETLAEALEEDESLTQVANVACLPGIVGCSLAMPDIHFGYGFPIGGVAAFRVDDGVVSPGGVGYDINCGCRVMATDLTADDLQGKTAAVVERLFRDVPSGVGSKGAIPRLSRAELERLLREGASWAVERGFGSVDDLAHTESRGVLPGADPAAVSERAYLRGQDQVGTLGSGNHFLELQSVDCVFDRSAAHAYGLSEGQVTLMIHCGSRGLGYQVCEDYLSVMPRQVVATRSPCLTASWSVPGGFSRGHALPVRYGLRSQLRMGHRQMIMHLVEQALLRALDISPRQLNLRLIYDVAHNIAKLETHEVEGRALQVCVHRKGATRAFAPGHEEVPEDYREAGQPVLIPGDMGTASFICKGTDEAMRRTFGSTCHGAGRVMSRSQALKKARGRAIDRELARKGIVVRSQGPKTLGEEMPEAYKDVERVVHVMDRAGISPRVARVRPLGVVKG
jgi:tRNA-splicing ligase RtcB